MASAAPLAPLSALARPVLPLAALLTVRGALVMPLMIRGQKKGLIKFALVTMRKP